VPVAHEIDTQKRSLGIPQNKDSNSCNSYIRTDDLNREDFKMVLFNENKRETFFTKWSKERNDVVFSNKDEYKRAASVKVFS
jgi:hypothetical protein